MTRLARFALAAPLLLLTACDGGSNAGAGAVSEGEARALDEAAEMLEQRRLPEGAIPPVGGPDESVGENEEEGASE